MMRSSGKISIMFWSYFPAFDLSTFAGCGWKYWEVKIAITMPWTSLQSSYQAKYKYICCDRKSYYWSACHEIRCDCWNLCWNVTQHSGLARILHKERGLLFKTGRCVRKGKCKCDYVRWFNSAKLKLDSIILVLELFFSQKRAKAFNLTCTSSRILKRMKQAAKFISNNFHIRKSVFMIYVRNRRRDQTKDVSPNSCTRVH